jgi:hypothetical protein
MESFVLPDRRDENVQRIQNLIPLVRRDPFADPTELRQGCLTDVVKRGVSLRRQRETGLAAVLLVDCSIDPAALHQLIHQTAYRAFVQVEARGEVPLGCDAKAPEDLQGMRLRCRHRATAGRMLLVKQPELPNEFLDAFLQLLFIHVNLHRPYLHNTTLATNKHTSTLQTVSAIAAPPGKERPTCRDSLR